MPCEVYWIEASVILGVDCCGPVTAGDMKQVMRQGVTAVAQQPTHFLIDLTQATDVPIDFVGMVAFSEWIYHPNARWFAYVNASDLLRSLVTVRHRNTCRFFKRREEALDFLRGSAQYKTDHH